MAAVRRRCAKGVVVGVAIVALGTLLFLDQEGFAVGYLFRFFGPAIFIFFGVETLVSSRGRGGRGLVGILLVAFGLLLLAGALGFLRAGLHTLWPVLLIIWGVWVIARTLGFGGDRGLSERIKEAVDEKFKNATGKESGQDWANSLKGAIQDTVNSWTGRESSDPEFDYMAIFGQIKQRVTVKNFRGGRLMALFGGFEVDLTRADIDGQTAVIDASALMGGGEIRVPYNWVVEIRGVAFLGGYSDETHQDVQDAATAKHLIVRGMAALGGVVIKN
jgi:Cell wall-active antibiotics response 4TMS YvqF